jgi:methionyl-tRNA synthetase
VGVVDVFGHGLDRLEFSEALKLLWVVVAGIDGYLTTNAPWKKPTDRSDEEHRALQARVLSTAAEAIRIITALVYPILPDAAAKVWLQLGQGEIADATKNAFLTNLAWGELKPGTKLGEPAPLFPRAEKDAIERMQNLEDENNRTVIEAAGGGGADAVSAAESSMPSAPEAPTSALGITPQPAAPEPTAAPAPPKAPAPASESAPTVAAAALAAEQPSALPQGSPSAQHITIDDFVKVDLRVAQILVAERVPKAEKLLRLEVDLGYEKRQILAGIAQYYEPEKLVGRKIVIVANLAPRKMRGLESNGMLLAASLPDGAPVLAGFLEEVPLGARLK